MNLLGQVFGFVLCAFVGLLGGTIIVWIWQGKIDLSALISESNGQASMSRFQLLIFTFVIAIGLYELIELRVSTTGFPDIPNGVLTLLGISASTYAVGKGISYSQPQTLTPQDGGEDAADAAAAADEAGMHAAAAEQAAAVTQAAVSQMAVHAAVAQQAVQQTAENAAVAQQAADQATGSQS
ncbi:MAG TPA: hypothetical protein VII23_11830 [Terriglobales bacterium]